MLPVVWNSPCEAKDEPESRSPGDQKTEPRPAQQLPFGESSAPPSMAQGLPQALPPAAFMAADMRQD